MNLKGLLDLIKRGCGGQFIAVTEESDPDHFLFLGTADSLHSRAGVEGFSVSSVCVEVADRQLLRIAKKQGIDRFEVPSVGDSLLAIRAVKCEG